MAISILKSLVVNKKQFVCIGLFVFLFQVINTVYRVLKLSIYGSNMFFFFFFFFFFSCINIRQDPLEVLKTEAEGRGFQHFPRDLANVSALKKPCAIAIIT